jgi:transketolase
MGAPVINTADRIATRTAYGETLRDLGRELSDLVVLDADLSCSTMTMHFAREFPDRFFNVGIAEQNLIDMACGMALAGKRVFASSFAMFATGKAWEMVRNSAGHMNLDVTIAATHSGLTLGEDGATHQILEDLAIMRVIPGMTVLVPADAVETRALVRAAARHRGPVYLRLGRPPVPVLERPADHPGFAIGRAEWLRRGGDVAIVACGIMVSQALHAAEELSAEGIQATVLNMSSIKPLDAGALIEAARLTGAVVAAEEHNIIGGLGGAVAECLGEEYPVPVVRVGTRDTYGESGTAAALLEKYGLTGRDVARAARQAIARKRV